MEKNKSKILLVTILIIILFNSFSCLKKNTKKEKINVVTTLFPIYDFAKRIGGKYSEVLMLLPPGVEAHHYEPTPSDIFKVTNAELFIYTSKNMEVWVKKFLNLKSKNIIEAAADINIIKTQESEKEDKHSEHKHNDIDPHVWLDFENCKKIAFNILNGYLTVKPEKKDYFIKNYEELIKELDELDKKYQKTLSKCRIKTIIYAGHAAFGYLATRYGLKQISPYPGFSMESEPTPDKIVNVIETIKTLNTKYIFYEKMTNNKIAQILAKETKVELIELNPAHNVTLEEFKKGITFVDIVNKNLENLKKGLDYQE